MSMVALMNDLIIECLLLDSLMMGSGVDEWRERIRGTVVDILAGVVGNSQVMTCGRYQFRNFQCNSVCDPTLEKDN